MNALIGPENRMFALAGGGRRLTNPVLATVVAFAAPLVLLTAGTALLDLLGVPVLDGSSGGSALDGALLLLLQNVFPFGLIALFLFVWVALYEGRGPRSLGLGPAGAGRAYSRGLVLGVLMFGAAVGAAALLGFAAWDRGTDPALRGAGVLGAVLLTYAGWAVQGSTEELLTRGWLLQAVGVRWGAPAGVLISSAVFTVLHSLNPNLSPISVLNLFLVGVFLALWVLLEGGLWGVFAWHAAWNWAQGNVFGYQVSGATFPGGALFDLREAGPDAITGGAFGPEGGLAVTLVLLVGIAVVVALARRGVAKRTPGA